MRTLATETQFVEINKRSNAIIDALQKCDDGNSVGDTKYAVEALLYVLSSIIRITRTTTSNKDFAKHIDKTLRNLRAECLRPLR